MKDKVIREVAKVDKDMIRSRIQGEGRRTREVIGGIRVGTGGCKDKSIHKSCWEAVGCC